MSVLYYSDFIKGNRVRFIAIILLVIGGSALLAGNNAANVLSQALILLVSGVLIITGRMNFGVFFSIGNFASTIFTELGLSLIHI